MKKYNFYIIYLLIFYFIFILISCGKKEENTVSENAATYNLAFYPQKEDQKPKYSLSFEEVNELEKNFQLNSDHNFNICDYKNLLKNFHEILNTLNGGQYHNPRNKWIKNGKSYENSYDNKQAYKSFSDIKTFLPFLIQKRNKSKQEGEIQIQLDEKKWNEYQALLKPYNLALELRNLYFSINSLNNDTLNEYINLLKFNLSEKSDDEKSDDEKSDDELFTSFNVINPMEAELKNHKDILDGLTNQILIPTIDLLNQLCLIKLEELNEEKKQYLKQAINDLNKKNDLNGTLLQRVKELKSQRKT
jgi:hypothetical protein